LLRLAGDLAKNPVTWPGLYPRYGLTNDGQALCPDCCRTERSLIGTTTGSDGWCLVDVSVDWGDSDTSCSHCGKMLLEGDAEDPNGSSEAPTVEERNSLYSAYAR
jgi:hypothetical protein